MSGKTLGRIYVRLLHISLRWHKHTQRTLEDGDKNEIANLRLPRRRKTFCVFFSLVSALSLWVGRIRNPLQVGFSLLCHRRERNCFSFTKMADKMLSIHKSSAAIFFPPDEKSFQSSALLLNGSGLLQTMIYVLVEGNFSLCAVESGWRTL